jgi:signal transduction histidine kinase
MLFEFLLENQNAILEMTAQKSLDLAGVRPSSAQLREGLPVFYQQLIAVLRSQSSPAPATDTKAMALAADQSDEPAIAVASGRPNESILAKSAGKHGREFMRLGYTLSHVVHAYGAMCQSITELSAMKNKTITAVEFHDLNRCLDVAIAGAVTEFQSKENSRTETKEVEHLGFLAHELRNALAAVNISLQMIKKGTVGFGGSTGRLMEQGLKQMDTLIERSLMEVRLRVDPEVHLETFGLQDLVASVVLTADVEAQSKNQIIEIHIDPLLEIEADQQLIFSALSNLIQNALKFTHPGGTVQIRAHDALGQVVIEVEDQCGGLHTDFPMDLFKPFEQQNKNRSGLGLGLNITERAVALNRGEIQVTDLPGTGCIFTVTLPNQLPLGVKSVLPSLLSLH